MKASGNQSRQSEQKILVVGAGLAGLAAAIWCAKNGLQVTVIETEKSPRDRPGEALHPGTECIFNQLGLKDKIQSANFLRYPGTLVKWDCGPTFVPFGGDENGPWLGYQIRRAELDSILLQQARNLGVVILQSCRALEIVSEANRVVGVKTSNGKYAADFTIDAAGSGHWLARKLKISIKRYSPPLYIQYGYVEGSCPPRDVVPAFTAIQSGWIWTAKVRDHVYQWMRLMFEKTSISYDWLPIEFQGLNVLQSARGADMSWRRVTAAAGLGYYIVGDASGVIDPASFHGILRGLMSGIMAAHSILQITYNRVRERSAAVLYNEWFSQWFLHDVIKLRKLYMRHPHHPTWTYWNNFPSKF